MTDYCAGYSKHGIHDRIAGMIFGHALGDAVGLITEFQEKFSPEDIKYPYIHSIRGVNPCDWTDDTDLLIMVMGSLMENNMKFIKSDIAQRFVYWCAKGLSYTGDKVPKTPNNTFKYIVTQKDYLTNVDGVAKRVSEQSKGTLIGNSPISRIAIVGALPNPAEMAENICRTTHIDSRCVASCVFFTCVLNSLIYSAEIDIDLFIAQAKSAALEYLPDEHKEEFEKVLSTGLQAPVAAFNLSEMARASNIYKTLLCIMYALNIIKVAQKHDKKPCFKKCIHSVVACGGDADANAIMVGSILGTYLGYKGIPQDWVKALPNSIPLSQFAATFMGKLFNPTTFEDNQAAYEKNEAADETVDVTADVTANTGGTDKTNEAEVQSIIENLTEGIGSEIADVNTDELTLL